MINEQERRIPWHVDPDNAEETFPDWPTTTIKWAVCHKYKDIYHSTPNYNRWDILPDDILLLVWVPNGLLAVEQLSLFLQALMGVPGLERRAATKFLNTLTWPGQPENEQLAAIATALGDILPSNGGKAGTLTVARTATEFDFERPTRSPVYLRFQKDIAETNVDIPRYPDGDRVEERTAGLDHGLLRAARRIQAVAAHPPVEIELALESYRISGGDISVGVTIREETSLDDLYRQNPNSTQDRGDITDE